MGGGAGTWVRGWEQGRGPQGPGLILCRAQGPCQGPGCAQLACYLLQRQQHELLGLGHVHEVLQHVPVCCLQQVAARVRVGKAPDAQAVGGVQLAQQELAAGVTDAVQLQKAGGWEQSLWGKKGEGQRQGQRSRM